MEIVEKKIVQYRASDGTLHDTLEDAEYWEKHLRDEELSKRISECTYKISKSDFASKEVLYGYYSGNVNPKWSLLHPLKQEDIDIINGFLDTIAEDEDIGVYVHLKEGKDFELDKDYIMIECSCDVWVYDPDVLKEFLIQRVNDSIEIIDSVLYDSNLLYVDKKKEETGWFKERAEAIRKARAEARAKKEAENGAGQS